MSIEMKNPKTPLEKSDAIANLIEQLWLAHKVSDEIMFSKAHKQASKLAFELTNELERNERT